MATTTATIDHPVIGRVEGVKDNGVIQFRGVQYGVLNHWLDNPKLPVYDGSGITATKFGPTAVSPPGGLANEHGIIQKSLPLPADPGSSATKCLNLNLNIPAGTTASSNLPVLVFIHGGGFFTGGNWWPQYDMRRIVQLSVDQKNPIIVANINYRLGMPGFLTSKELRDAGYQSNNGHHDQRMALKWVKKFISGFGGDPDRVTGMGESVGGLSTLRLLNPNEDLASRIVVLAGAPPLMSPQPLEAAEAGYSSVIDALGLGSATSDERVAKLVEASPEVLATKLSPQLMFSPLIDGYIIDSEPTFESIHSNPPWGKTSCKAIMVGYSPFDASVLGMMGLFQRKQGIGAAFSSFVKSVLASHKPEAKKLLQLYGLGEGSSIDDDGALMRVLQFASDIGYCAPAHVLAKTFPGEAFVLQFSEPNPWDGPFKGYTTHVLDIAFIFQNYREHLDAEQLATSEKFATDIIHFSNGSAPWDDYHKSGTVAVYENGTRICKEGQAVLSKEYQGLVKIGEVVGLDTLASLVVGFVFGTLPSSE
ncbi:hypothetical protein SEUCBS139899_005556 [Sporothrix eucalyptigena]|uniref:Carboxylesterase type B domain-containing protein n=1 Tax=Sporothrix eucalyptigena TaxID=1812306 RepID=A0ABP0C1A2_9PEZI